MVEQSKIILQIEGRDTMSELDKHTVAGGMGSVFDPDSEISKLINRGF